ncbi:TetR/AcrR family transcriptional regulator [bacterium]|nr:TetR/AcrR family transcriptional regulator [bacterium]
MPEKTNRKGIIVDIAQGLFSRFGFLKTTIDEIAKAARMGKASLYHYFRNKEDIFREVINKESKVLSNKIREAVDKEETPQEKIKAFIITRMKYLKELVNIYAALKDEYLTHYAFIEKARENNYKEEIETVKAILDEGIAKKIFIAPDVELTSFAIISALKGLEYPWTIKIPVPELEDNLNKLLEILFNGIVKK